MSEPIRMVYRQLRRNLPVDGDMFEEIQHIATTKIKDSSHRLTSSMVENYESTDRDRIEVKAQALRRAFNRRHFIQCNLLKFGPEELKKEDNEFEEVARYLHFATNSPLVSLTKKVERNLKKRQYFPICNYIA